MISFQALRDKVMNWWRPRGPAVVPKEISDATQRLDQAVRKANRHIRRANRVATNIEAVVDDVVARLNRDPPDDEDKYCENGR